MILRQFPDLQWLKRQIGQDFRAQKAPNGTVFEPIKWPTVILNVTTRHTERPDIRGPLSVFTNLSGESFAAIHRHRVRVSEQSYFISNQDEHYWLDIDSPHPVQTFNIHFGQHFTEGLFQSLVLPADKLLDGGPEMKGAPVHFFNKLYPRKEPFNQLIRQIYTAHQSRLQALLLEEQLTQLLMHLLEEHQQLTREMSKLPPIKQSTREEIYRKLSLSVDYLYTYYEQHPTLDELALVACLSKFHFLRLFKTAFGLTPYQFLTHIRLERACQLLRATKLPVQDIAGLLGFENASSFSRIFYKMHKVYPTAYRSNC